MPKKKQLHFILPLQVVHLLREIDSIKNTAHTHIGLQTCKFCSTMNHLTRLYYDRDEHALKFSHRKPSKRFRFGEHYQNWEEIVENWKKGIS